MNTPKKQKYDRKIAIRAAKIIVDAITPLCERIIVAGSLRRRKLRVSDVEILLIPTFATEPDGLFETTKVNLVDRELARLLKIGVLEKRKNVLGSEIWGPKNKLGREVSTGVPIDIFTATPEAWFNMLVCRTGGARNNTLIAEAYQRQGKKWNPYGPGFTIRAGHQVRNASEAEVYENAGLKYLQPWERP